MDSAQKIELLLKKILRYDFYLNSSNIKASVIITWNGLLIGTILLKSDDLLKLFCQPPWAHFLALILLVIAGILSVISIWFAFLVLFPFLDSGRKTFNSPSLFFFGDVSGLCLEKYIEKEKEASSDEVLTDLASQAYILAKGLNQKMIKLQRGTKAIIGGLICLGLLVFLKAFLFFARS